MGLLFRVFICILVLAVCLYSVINEQNKITKLQFVIPMMTKAIQEIEEETTRLQYEIECFENPLHLMELARLKEYSHLKHPRKNEILAISVKNSYEIPCKESSQEIQIPSTLSLATLLFQKDISGTYTEER